MSWLLDLTEDKVDSFDVVPKGTYLASCEDAEIKTTKDGTGEYINAKFSIIGSDFDNRKVFNMFNIKNKNDQAVKIGRAKLKEFLIASGKKDFTLKSVKDLCGLKAQIVVNVKEDEMGKKNSISGFKPITGAQELSTIPF